MSPEKPQNPPLTPDQEALADFYLRQCPALQPYANTDIKMRGEPGSVRYGLGRCAHHFSDMTPQEVTDFVMLKLEQQKSNPS